MRSAQARRRLVAVMFTDIVGYSAMTRADEARTLRLLAAHFRTVRRLLRRYGGREVKTIGDAFLLRFDSALAAVHCAIAIQQQLRSYNHKAPTGERYQLRIGLHLGDVEARGGDLFGDGVNLAARVLPLAPPGGLAVTGAVQSQLHGPLGAALRPTGPQALRNIPQPVEVFELSPETLDGLSPLAEAPRWHPALLPRGLPYLLSAALLAGLGLFALLRPAPVPADQRSVAVLPFENLSDDAANGHFADGMQDEVLSRLARLPGLRVVARGSTRQLSSRAGDPAALARRLDVAHLLEGSVQRAGERLRIHLRLLRAADRQTVWAERYDRTPADLFAVQSEVAAAVAEALDLHLSPLDRQPLPAPANAAAYDAHLRGLARLHRPSPTPQDRAEAERAFARAVELDPAFAPAWAGWAQTLAYRYLYGEDASEAARDRAREAVDRALRLAPQLDEARLAQGYFQYWVEQRYSAAQASFERLHRDSPRQAEPLYALALIARRTGQWEASLRHFEASARLDPLNAGTLADWGLTLMGLRRFADAEQLFDRALAVQPGDAQLLGRKASSYLARGELSQAEALLQGLPLETWDYVGAARFTLWQYQRRYAEIIATQQRFIAALPPDADFDHGIYGSFLGWTQRAAGQPAAARASFATARTALERVVPAQSDNYAAWSALAAVAAGQGDVATLRRAGERSLAIFAEAGDAYWAPVMEEFLARAEAGLGRADWAVPRLRRLLRQPYGEWPLTETDLRLSPDWDPIRDDPGFRALLGQ